MNSCASYLHALPIRRFDSRASRRCAHRLFHFSRLRGTLCLRAWNSLFPPIPLIPQVFAGLIRRRFNVNVTLRRCFSAWDCFYNEGRLAGCEIRVVEYGKSILIRKLRSFVDTFEASRRGGSARDTYAFRSFFVIPGKITGTGLFIYSSECVESSTNIGQYNKYSTEYVVAFKFLTIIYNSV